MTYYTPSPIQRATHCAFAPTINMNFLYAQNAPRTIEQNRDAFTEYMRMKSIPPRCAFVRGCEVPAAKARS